MPRIVRGVGAGGIVSTAFCILYKLFTLKLTRKQVVGLINHNDSPYIRALGFMYIRYTQPPVDLWDWYEPYLEDEEEIDVKAGGGQIMTMGEMLRHFLSKLEWFSTLFPRIPVPIQKDLERKLSNWRAQNKGKINSLSEETTVAEQAEELPDNPEDYAEDVSVSGTSSHYDAKTKEIDDSMKDTRLKEDLADEIAREKERQKRDRDRHGNSSKHHSSEHHKSYSSSRGRSRSPFDSKSYKDDSKKYRSKPKEGDRHSNHHRHREYNSHHKEDSDYEKIYRDKKHSYDRRDERKPTSYSHSLDKKHNHSHSHNRNRH